MKTNLSVASCLAREISALSAVHYFGHITSVKGLLVEVRAPSCVQTIGRQALILANPERRAEVIGFNGGHALMMVFGSCEGLGVSQRVVFEGNSQCIFPTVHWIGRTINAMGAPIDNKGPLEKGEVGYSLNSAPLPAIQRNRVGSKIDLGVRVINTFLSCCSGQRMGIFAGSGVGKSVLLSMIARFTDLDVIVIGLIGERAREVQEFIQEHLGEEGLKRSIVVVASSGEPALIRRQAAYLTLTLAEFLADQGKQVLCLMDSVTRFAMALREIGLSVGEPPTAKGYPPSVFAELARLLERAGPRQDAGSITGLFTVLVEGDDHNEPIADAIRSILDGHIVLNRKIAERGRFPAVDVLRSVSRTLPRCNSERENALVSRAKELLSAYEDMEELIRLGAYKKGSDSKVDEAIFYQNDLISFLSQSTYERALLQEGYNQLEQILERQKMSNVEKSS
ncbi:MAG: flagellar protein export ATPase FliI [Holosporales bacterium]|jgi:flagellum-specific ATP synthase|nr:flagellar protein export ATPase FliI [Holosporales bacterium]